MIALYGDNLNYANTPNMWADQVNISVTMNPSISSITPMPHVHRWAHLNAGGIECFTCGARP